MIWINGLWWNVTLVPWNNYNLINFNGKYTIGMTDTEYKTIYINNQLSEALFRKTLIHELTHAWLYSYGIVLDISTEEFVCDFVAANSDDILSKADEYLWLR